MERNISVKLHCKTAFKPPAETLFSVEESQWFLDARPPGQNRSKCHLRPSQHAARGALALKKNFGNVSPVTFLDPPLEATTFLIRLYE